MPHLKIEEEKSRVVGTTEPGPFLLYFLKDVDNDQFSVLNTYKHMGRRKSFTKILIPNQ